MYRQNRNEVSLIGMFAFKILVSQFLHQSVKNTMLKTSMPKPKAFYVICVFVERRVASAAIYICCACMYTSRKPACCSIDIVKEILICASHLNSILFAFDVFKICISFCSSFFLCVCFYHKTPLDAVEAPRERSERRENALQTQKKHHDSATNAVKRPRHRRAVRQMTRRENAIDEPYIKCGVNAVRWRWTP